ncbi:L,D-transpeptidase family protein [Sphingosinicella sp. CPCC 101087]|uniref:L,D-transpeptidase family protein n=1 Tax=Sphingosinicella sp. CPCC 101087 TaxID=2497754 RepID=UPI00101E228C|nr:L,D-transpeptidase family protein [Sphingosinicella sp. CPCC 101087]
MIRVFRRCLLATTASILLTLSPVHAAQAEDASEIITEAAGLRPGDYLWQPERAQSGEVEIVVSVPLQRAYVYRGGVLIGVTTVSTGRRGHDTPVGTFAILQKRREHYSNLYNNAPMPFMQRLTWDGVALHAGQIPGHPASHGCIRLPLAFARHLFAATQLGGSVHVTDIAPSSPEIALAMVRPDGAYTGMGGPEEPLADN